MIYWNNKGVDSKDREFNVKIAWSELKKMTKYLKKHVDVSCYLFEFGDEFLFDDSIHIDFKSEYYNRSKRMNLTINYPINDNGDFFAFSDADLFFPPYEYENILNDILNLEKEKEHVFYTYNLIDINKNQVSEVINLQTLKVNYELLKTKFQKEEFKWRHSYGAGTLGGFFICRLDDLKKMGGFNEKILTWGGEDDDAQVRMYKYSQWRPKMWRGPFHLYHYFDTNNPKFYIPVYSDEYYKINKIPKIR